MVFVEKVAEGSHHKGSKERRKTKSKDASRRAAHIIASTLQPHDGHQRRVGTTALGPVDNCTHVPVSDTSYWFFTLPPLFWGMLFKSQRSMPPLLLDLSGCLHMA